MTQSLKNLTTEQRALLEQRLLAKGTSVRGLDQQISPRNGGGPWLLSFEQQRMWVLDRLLPVTGLYNIVSLLQVHGHLDPPTLQSALDAVVARHEALRSTFQEDGGDPRVQVHAEQRIPVRFLDLGDKEGSEQLEMAEAVARKEAGVPFDLARGPLLRVTLMRLADNEHVLLLTMHHIVSDGWSMGVLGRELCAVYGRLQAGATPDLEPLPLQYPDYAEWQRHRAGEKLLERQLDYWRSALGGLTSLELPTDRQRPRVPSYRGGQVRFSLPPTLTRTLRTLAARENATLFMVLLAGFQTLLYRWSGHTDIAVGTPVAGRKRRELEGLIGLFVNTLVLRTQLQGERSFQAAIKAARNTAVGAFDHPDIPFERLVEVLRPERDLSRNPLFQIMFSLQNTPSTEFRVAGLRIAPAELSTETARFDLSLFVSEEANQLECTLEYACDLFDRATAERLCDGYLTLLQGACAHPDKPISKLPLLSPEQQRLLLIEWNRTHADYPREQCIDQLMSSSARRSPAKTAVSQGAYTLSYGELEARSDVLGGYLRSLGVGPDLPVGLHLQRSPRLLVAMLGVLKAGGAYLPLDPSFPQDRLAYMLADSGATVVLTESGLDSLVGETTTNQPQSVRLDSDWNQIAAAPTPTGPAAPRSSEDLAYIIYTSGSTGRPKGVEVPHRAVVNFLQSMRREPGLGEEDVLLAVTTLSFDIAVLELLLPLVAGATVVIAQQQEAADGRLLARCLDQCNATVMQATPATWRMLIDVGWSGRESLRAYCGGERLGQDLVRQLLGRVGALWNLYGPTEATVWSTVERITSAAKSITVGRPIANTRVYILDSHACPVPIGVPGQLWIGGDGLARGYHNRPDLTAERFKTDPFVEPPGARIYATGDLARYHADASIEVLGRLDFQVKVRGFRIELGEIENALSRVPGIGRAVVAAPEDSVGVARLVAFLTAANDRPEARPDPADIRRRLGSELPDYMVPSEFHFLDSMPLTPNGKVDRLALTHPSASTRGPRSENSYVPPRNPTEQTIAQVAEELLGQPRVGIHDDFFALGGHSLLGVRLLVEIEKRYKVNLPLPTLFATPTIAGLAEALERGAAQPAFRSMMAVRADGDRPPFFCVQGDPSSLAPHLHPQQPYYWLHHALNAPVVPYATVPEIAASHVTELRTVQPRGPYYLGGFSFGGVVAYEMAQQLRATGEEVGLLALFDATPPQQTRSTRAQKVGRHADILATLGAGERLSYLARVVQQAAMARLKFLQRWLKGFRNQLLLQYYRRSGEPLPASMLVNHRLRLFLKAARRYRFEPYGGDVTLFIPGGGKSREERLQATRARWRDLIRGRAEIHIIDSAYRHSDLFRLPFSKDLATQLNPYLPKGQGES